MKKFNWLKRLLVFLRILEDTSEDDAKYDAWLDREERGFPFSDLIGFEVKCGEQTFKITDEMEKSSCQDAELSKGGMTFRFWMVECPFCKTHKFKIFSSLRVYAIAAK